MNTLSTFEKWVFEKSMWPVSEMLLSDDGSGDQIIWQGRPSTNKLPLNDLKAEAVWCMRRITIENNTVTIEYADGNIDFDNVWNNRYELDYKIMV